jgi:phospholipid/cholesterol/gamma-HCH transport system substrate-binding protein
MNERVVQFRVGVMVAATLLIAAILIMVLGERPALFQKKYTIFIVFRDAPGVTAETPIHKSGILIGRVADTELLDEGGVKVTANIDSHIKLRENEVCQVTGSLLGDAVLRFVLPEGEPFSDKIIQPGAILQGKVRALVDLQESLAEAIGSVADTSKDLGKVVQRIDRLLEDNEERINKVIVQSDETLTVVKRAVEHFDELIGDQHTRDQLRKAASELPEMLKESRDTVARMDKMFESVERNLNHIERFTKPLGENGEQLVRRLDSGLQNLDELTSELTTFAKAVNSEQSSLGRLLKDDELYQNLSIASRNLRDASRQLRPIINDARVFTDKIARHPGILVRDAVRPGPGTKGVIAPRWSLSGR